MSLKFAPQDFPEPTAAEAETQAVKSHTVALVIALLGDSELPPDSLPVVPPDLH
jgi:hypothetical protein